MVARHRDLRLTLAGDNILCTASTTLQAVRIPRRRFQKHIPHSSGPALGDTHTMPTPESASFKAAKPTVPPTFDGVDYDDNKALKAAQDSVIREQWVQSMMARLIREELGKCYYREGVNHLEKCGHLRGELERSEGVVRGEDANAVLQTGIWSSSSTRRSRATCFSSRTMCRRSRGTEGRAGCTVYYAMGIQGVHDDFF